MINMVCKCEPADEGFEGNNMYDFGPALAKMELKDDDVVLFKLSIHKERNSGEYIVKWIEAGKWSEDKSYFTGDLKDALATMEVMFKEYMDKH